MSIADHAKACGSLPAHRGAVFCWERRSRSASDEICHRRDSTPAYTVTPPVDRVPKASPFRSRVRASVRGRLCAMDENETRRPMAPVGFAASLLNLGALLNGGRLVVMPPGLPRSKSWVSPSAKSLTTLCDRSLSPMVMSARLLEVLRQCSRAVTLSPRTCSAL